MQQYVRGGFRYVPNRTQEMYLMMEKSRRMRQLMLRALVEDGGGGHLQDTLTSKLVSNRGECV